MYNLRENLAKLASLAQILPDRALVGAFSAMVTDMARQVQCGTEIELIVRRWLTAYRLSEIDALGTMQDDYTTFLAQEQHSHGDVCE